MPKPRIEPCACPIRGHTRAVGFGDGLPLRTEPLSGIHTNEDYAAFAQCSGCGLTGPSAVTTAQAAAQWNRNAVLIHKRFVAARLLTTDH